jgi:hypothetical protein
MFLQILQHKGFVQFFDRLKIFLILSSSIRITKTHTQTFIIKNNLLKYRKVLSYSYCKVHTQQKKDKLVESDISILPF